MLRQNHGTMYIRSPYIDTRAPLVADTPEERRFRAAHLDNNLITTGWSDTLVVTAQG